MKNQPSLLLILAAALGLAAVDSARAALVITEVMAQSVPSGSPAGSGTPDWFELTNTGPGVLDLTGFRIDDASPTLATSVPLNFTLGASLAVGQSAVFLESSAANNGSEIASFRTFWGGAALTANIGYYFGSGVGLGAGGDAVNLFDGSGSGTVVTGVTFSAVTTGTSLDNRAGAASLSTANNSVVGVNGAYTSADAAGNVGSPGVVPEPSAWVFIGGCGALALAFGRRRVRRAV